MEVPLVDRDAKFYSKLFVAHRDIEFARYCAGVLLKKGWHSQPWERRGTIYDQQAAFTTALIIAYGRAFTQSKGWPKLPQELIDYNDQEKALHARLLDLRHTVYAHSDGANYSIRPWRAGTIRADIVGAPALRITADEASLFQAMTSKLLSGIAARMNALLAGANVASAGNSKGP